MLRPSRPRRCFHQSYGSARSTQTFSQSHGGISAPLQCYTLGTTRYHSYRRQSRRSGLGFSCRICGGSSERSARRCRRWQPNHSALIYPGSRSSRFATNRTRRNSLCILHHSIYPSKARGQTLSWPTGRT